MIVVKKNSRRILLIVSVYAYDIRDISSII